MSQIPLHSTNGKSPAVNLRDALMQGQAPDKGLYLPDAFPKFTPDEIAAFATMPYHNIAFRVISKYSEGVIPDHILEELCQDAYNYEVPLERVNGMDHVSVMRLDQG